MAKRHVETSKPRRRVPHEAAEHDLPEHDEPSRAEPPPRRRQPGHDGGLLPAAVRDAMTSVSEKKHIEVARCAIEIARGNRKSTVMPPSTPWKTTSTAASTPSVRSPRSRRKNKSTISATVIIPTAVATSRCVCSYWTPYSIFGKSVP